MEQVDIINDKDEVIGVTSKEEAHEKGLRHRIVIAELKNSKGEYLLIRQAGDKQDPGQFVSPAGGHVQAGESEEDALKREVAEEIGITEEFKYELLGKFVYDRFVQNRQENHYFIVYQIYSDATPVLNEECDGCRFFTEDEIRKEVKEHPELFGAPFHYLIERMFPQWLS